MNQSTSQSAAKTSASAADTAAATDPRSFGSFAEFYPFYLTEHSNPVCRRLHFAGSSLTLLCLAALLVTFNPLWLLAGLVCGYGFA